MHRTLKIAEREYLETVRTKTFIFGILMAPIIVVAIIFFTGRMVKEKEGPRPPVKAAMTDLSGELAEEIKAAFEAYNKSHPQRQIDLQQVESDQAGLEQAAAEQKEKLRNRKLDVYFVVDKEVISGEGKVHFYMCGTKAATFDAPFTIENLLNNAVVNRRCKLRDLSPQLLAELRRRVPTEHIEVGLAGDKEQVQSQHRKVAQMMVPFFFMYLMFLGIFLAGQHMLTSIIEEKSSRVVEVLLSAVTPFELMAGKIAGLVGIGLTVISLWAVAAYGTARWKGLSVEVGAELMVYFVVYYILGFAFFSAIMAGIGSVCNTLKETQSLMMPISLIFVLPMISWFNLANHPDGTYARILSFVPPLTPMVMMLRLSASSHVWVVEVIASIVVLAAAVVGVMWCAAKVFRTGILMYGKRPAMREVLRWLKQS
ncbi:MAG TPA: ABC transporter permease [Sedimentisphaerales bacterium]|nr:ABC transporter permease [Sedimentisphaerales bacterium]